MTDKRIYEIITNDGTYRMEIPEDWKITFGPVAIGAGKRNAWDAGGGSMALRIYESEVRQRAIVTGVESFRDLSIPLTKLVRTVKANTAKNSARGPKGTMSSETNEVEYDDRWEAA